MKKLAYKHKGMKQPANKQDMKVSAGDQSMAPQTKPSKAKSHPKAEWMYPQGGKHDGAQSVAPDHRRAAMPSEHKPEGASEINGGQSMSMPKCGGVGETEC